MASNLECYWLIFPLQLQIRKNNSRERHGEKDECQLWQSLQVFQITLQSFSGNAGERVPYILHTVIEQ